MANIKKEVSLADLKNARFVKNASELKKTWIMNAANEGRVIVLSGKPDEEVVRSQCKAEALRMMEALIEYVVPKYQKNYNVFCKQLVSDDTVWGKYLSITMGTRKGQLNVSRLLAIIQAVQKIHPLFVKDVKFLFNKIVPARANDENEKKYRASLYSGQGSYKLKKKEKGTIESLLAFIGQSKS